MTNLLTEENSNLSKYLKAIIIIGLLLVLGFVAYNVYLSAKSVDGFIFLDWLINYHDGGFKRRGFGGSFFIVVHDFTHVSLIHLVFAAQLFFYVLFFGVLIRLLIHKIVTLDYVIFLFSPLSIFFMLNDPDGIGRKEILLYVIFSLYTYWCSNGKLSSKREYLVLSMIFIATLWHELVFFYTPYFLLVRHLFSSESKFKLDLKYFFASLIPMVAITLFGSEINNGNSVKILNDRGLFFNNGIFMWNETSFSWWGKNGFEPYLLYAVPILYGLGMLYYYLTRQNENVIWIITYILISFLFSIPLFVLAVDWGRWIAIHFTLLLVILTSRLKKEGAQKIILANEVKSTQIIGYIFLILNFLFMLPHVKVGLKLNSFFLTLMR